MARKERHEDTRIYRPADSSTELQERSEELHAYSSPRSSTDAQEVPDTVARAVTNLSEGVSTLVKGHLALARVEVAEDVRAIVKDAALTVGGGPILLIGYLLLWISIGFLLGTAMPLWVAFLIVAGANLIAGAAMMLIGAKRTKQNKIQMEASTEEIKRDKQWLPTLRERPETMRGHLHS